MRVLRQGSIGDDVASLQEKLKTAGYDVGEVDGIFGAKTHSAVVKFQTKVFGAAQADGVVGPLTMAELDKTHKPTNGKYYLRAVRLDFKDSYGNYLVALSVCPQNTSIALETIHVVTGQDYAQIFRKGGTGEQPGSMEPAPEGRYRLKSPQWGRNPGDYSTFINAGLGPVFYPFDPLFSTDRGAFGIHLDGNRASAPGTAGCLGVLSYSDLRKVVGWYEKYDLVGSYLIIDWPGYGNPGE